MFRFRYNKTSATAEQSKAGKGDSTSYRISAANQIRSLLKNLMRGTALISVNLPREEAQYASAILKVAEDVDVFYLDELNDPQAHQRFSKAKRVEVEARLDGVLVRFSTDLQKAGKSKDGIGFYRAALPLYLFYFQRRDTHRVKITREQLPVRGVIKGSSERIQGVMHDLSIGGIGFIARTERIMQRGDIIERSLFQLPNGEEFSCDLEIRFLQELRQQSVTRIGCQFLDLAATEQQVITQEVARLERELLRKR
jgi:c-di-GMP-binding flagellar brake protein YcgR